jgi:hypothetical protein
MVRRLTISALCAGLTAGLLAGQVPRTPSGVISGVVTDELNRPMPGVTVTAFRLSQPGQLLAQQVGESALWPRGQVQKQTNDLGEFRLWPLEAGEYVVAVVVSRVTSPIDENRGGCWGRIPVDYWSFVPAVDVTPVEWLLDASRRHLLRIAPELTSPADAPTEERGYVTTYSPRATALTDARHVILGDKQHEGGVDIQLQLRPAVRVTGRIAGVQIWDSLDIELTNRVGGARTKTSADGSFVFLSIPVGPYSLVSPGTSSTCDTRSIYGPSHEGRVDVTVERGDQNHFTLTVGPKPTVQRGATVQPSIERVANPGSIEGVVTTDTGQPLDRVRVRVTSSGLREGATAVTGTDGRFLIEHLPPDVFTLTVSRAGFVDHMYRLRPRDRDGTPIQLGAGQRFVARVAMTRPGVIAGVVRNDRGMPMPGVNVCCGSDGWTETDDRGQYRLWPVPVGDRTVSAFDARGRGVFRGYLRTYYPGVTDEAAAGKVHVDPGSVQVIDIDARPPTAGPTARLTVRVRSADGWVGTFASVYLDGNYQNHQRAVPDGEPPTADLVATFSSVPAGKHVVSVNPENSWFGSEAIVTDGRTPANVVVVMTRKPQLLLRVVYDGPGQSIDFFQWRLWKVMDSPAWNSASHSGGGGESLDAGGRATLPDLSPGRYVLDLKPEGSWIASSARLDGREILDGPFTLEAGATAELAVTFTNRRTSLEGVVRDAAGSTTAAADVLIFSVDRHFWTPGSRRIRLVRPRSDGRYEVSALPPGEYAVIAQEQVDPDDVNPDWLESRLPGSARVTLIEDATQQLSLRVR